jgi:transcriptional regulator with PAS, ATPase and Fis domain
MIFIDVNETIILFNQMAEKMVGQKREDVIGRPIKDVVPNTKLPRILETREPEYNHKNHAVVRWIKNPVMLIRLRLQHLDKLLFFLHQLKHHVRQFSRHNDGLFFFFMEQLIHDRFIACCMEQSWSGLLRWLIKIRRRKGCKKPGNMELQPHQIGNPT